MFATLASLLLLGTFPQLAAPQTIAGLPGIELLTVHSPTLIRHLPLPPLTASGVVLVDADSGEELYSFHADIPMPMASTTKIMTSLLLLEHHAPSETVTIPAVAEHIGGSTLKLRPYEHFRLSDLLKGMLLPSANDVAYALAIYDAKTIGKFVGLMNGRAKDLGLLHTHFANPAGLDNELQFMSPRDLSWLTLAALRYPLFRSIVGLSSGTITSQEGVSFELTNTNELLHSHSNVLGVKTGTTDAAHECLVLLFTEQHHSYLLVLLGAKDRYTDALSVMQAVHDALAS